MRDVLTNLPFLEDLRNSLKNFKESSSFNEHRMSLSFVALSFLSILSVLASLFLFFFFLQKRYTSTAPRYAVTKHYAKISVPVVLCSTQWDSCIYFKVLN